ncbi:MAG: helix-turn-helix transcriptional regulator [Bacteroidota bacterium]
MDKPNLKSKIIQQAKREGKWLEEAKERQQNAVWLDWSFRIAIKVLGHLRANHISQKEMAGQLGWSPQYFSRVLKGKENLTLETIGKMQRVVGIPLLEVPADQHLSDADPLSPTSPRPIS